MITALQDNENDDNFYRLEEFTEYFEKKYFSDETRFLIPRYLNLIHTIYERLSKSPLVRPNSVDDYGVARAMAVFIYRQNVGKSFMNALDAMQAAMRPLFAGYYFMSVCEKNRKDSGVLSMADAFDAFEQMPQEIKTDVPRTLLQDGLFALTELDFNPVWETWQDFETIVDCIKNNYLDPFQGPNWTQKQALASLSAHELYTPAVLPYLETVIDTIVPFLGPLSAGEILRAFMPVMNQSFDTLFSTKVCPVLKQVCTLAPIDFVDFIPDIEVFPRRLLVNTLLRKKLKHVEEEQVYAEKLKTLCQNVQGKLPVVPLIRDLLPEEKELLTHHLSQETSTQELANALSHLDEPSSEKYFAQSIKNRLGFLMGEARRLSRGRLSLVQGAMEEEH